jgi:hypothetical protein
MPVILEDTEKKEDLYVGLEITSITSWGTQHLPHGLGQA